MLDIMGGRIETGATTRAVRAIAITAALLVAVLISVESNGIAQTSSKPVLDRLATEAAAYEKFANQVTGEETIHQRVLKTPRYRLRTGEAAKKALQPEWREREIVSLYGIAVVGQTLHEIRQVLSVDGKALQGEARAQETLVRLITAKGDRRKLQALQQLEKYTLGSAATDFGPLILVFAHGGAERYEFTFAGPRLLGTSPARAYQFKQLDGAENLTLFAGQAQKLRIEGEVWIADDPQGPLRINLSSTVPNPDSSDAPAVREEATVDYDRTAFGALLTAHIEQKELHGGEVTAENTFDYENYHRLAAH